MLGRDDRARTVLDTAADVDRDLLPEPVRDLLDGHERTVAACRTAHRRHHSTQTVERELAAELPGAAGRGRAAREPPVGAAAPADVHHHRRGPVRTRRRVQSPGAVRAVAQDVHAVQVLTIHPDAADDQGRRPGRDHRRRPRTSGPVTDQVLQQGSPRCAGVARHPGAADQAAAQGYADSIRRPAAAVKHFDDGSWVLPVGSLVIVDDADHLDPGLLASLVEQAATRTNTKLLLITNHHATGRDAERTTNDGVAVLRESLPWAHHIGTPEHREQPARHT